MYQERKRLVGGSLGLMSYLRLTAPAENEKKILALINRAFLSYKGGWG